MQVKKFVIIVAICFIGLWLILLFLWDLGLRLNSTPSLPIGIYEISQEEPKRGDFVTFCLGGNYANLARERGYVGNGICPSGLNPLLKTLVGMPSDIIMIDKDGIHISAYKDFKVATYPLPLPFDIQGRALSSILSSGTIPDNMALVMTMHEGGFDSRYFGFISFVNLCKVNEF